MDTKTILEENREYKQKINALTKQLKGEQQYADEQDEALGIFQQSFLLGKNSDDLILEQSFCGNFRVRKKCLKYKKAKINQESD